MAGITYDDCWITQGLAKLEARYSNVLVFETRDPERRVQIQAHFEKMLGAGNVHRFDPWNGLTPPEPPDPTSTRYGARPVSNDNLIQSMVVIERRLKQKRGAAIFNYLNPNDEEKRRLADAIRSWTDDVKIRATGSFFTVLTDDAETLFDEHTRSRVIIIPVEPSSDEERRSITRMSSATPLPAETENQIVNALRGLTLKQATSVLLEAAASTKGKLNVAAVVAAKAALIKQERTLDVVEHPDTTFADIGGYEYVKAAFRDNVTKAILELKRFLEFKTPTPRGILLFGPPGTGKTLLASAFAAEAGLPFIRLLYEDVISSYLGESGHRMKSALGMIDAMSPSVVFIDEIDRLGKRRESTDSAGEETRRVFSMLLEWLAEKNRKSIIVGATNRPGDLDEAFIRNGRFDFKIPVLFPNADARAEILKIHLGLTGRPSDDRHRPLLVSKPTEIEYALATEIVPETFLFSGGDLEELVNRAKREAFCTGACGVSVEHILNTLRQFRISRRDRAETLRECWVDVQKFTDDANLINTLFEEFKNILNPSGAEQEETACAR
jgi:ATP-dependent 26S proteasome regulatory subunit